MSTRCTSVAVGKALREKAKNRCLNAAPLQMVGLRRSFLDVP